MRSYPTIAFEAVSVIFERSRMGLYILPRYRRNTMSTPALSPPAIASRAPYQSTRQVPAATITSTSGASLALRLRACIPASTLARLSTSNRFSS